MIMENKNIDFDSIAAEIVILKLEYDDREFPIDATIIDVNDRFSANNAFPKSAIGKKISKYVEKAPNYEYSLKLMDYVLRSGQAGMFFDYWESFGSIVYFYALRINYSEIALVLYKREKSSYEEFIMSVDDMKVRRDIINENDEFFTSTFVIDTKEGFNIQFVKKPDGFDSTALALGVENYFISLIHPNDVQLFKEQFKLENISADIANNGRWEIVLRRRGLTDYRYTKCVIKQSSKDPSVYLGWEYDDTSERIMIDSKDSKDIQIELYYKALETFGRQYYLVYGVNLQDNSIILLTESDEYTSIIYEQKVKGKNEIRVHEDLIHPDDIEMVKEFFDMNIIKKAFSKFSDTISLRFRRIIDWEYKWVEVIAHPVFYYSKEIVLFSFENINDKIEKNANIECLLKILKKEYETNIVVNLDTMDYQAEWNAQSVKFFNETGNYSVLFNRMVTDKMIQTNFDDVIAKISPECLVENYNPENEDIVLKYSIMINKKKYKIKTRVYYALVNDKKIAYLLVKNISE
jgi:hypothetical protein